MLLGLGRQTAPPMQIYYRHQEKDLRPPPEGRAVRTNVEAMGPTNAEKDGGPHMKSPIRLSINLPRAAKDPYTPYSVNGRLRSRPMRRQTMESPVRSRRLMPDLAPMLGIYEDTYFTRRPSHALKVVVNKFALINLFAISAHV